MSRGLTGPTRSNPKALDARCQGTEPSEERNQPGTEVCRVQGLGFK